MPPPVQAEATQQAPHPAHAFRIEAVGGLVEDQGLGVAEQCVGEAQALAHAERVLADTPPGRRFVEADELQQRVDALRRHAHGVGGDGERLAAAAPGVLGGRVEKDADAPARVRQLAVASAEDLGVAAVGLGEADEHPHRGGLCRHRWGRKKRVTVPGSQRKVTSETTVRPPSCLVSPLVWIMPADSRAAGFAATVRGLRSPSPTAVADDDFGRGSRPWRSPSLDPRRWHARRQHALPMACPAGCGPRCPAVVIDGPDEERGRRDHLVDATIYLVAFAISAATLAGTWQKAPALAARRGHCDRDRDARRAALAAYPSRAPSGSVSGRSRSWSSRPPARTSPPRSKRRDPGSRPRSGHHRRAPDRLGLREPAALPLRR